MQRKWWIAGALGIALVAGLVALPFFLPEKSVQLNQELPEGAAEEAQVMVHRSGTWKDGDAAHSASGTIAIVTVEDQVYLQFADFQMTRGPDVYLYLTQDATPRTTQEVEGDGVRIAVKTDEDTDSRLNERGDFFVPLDMSLEDLTQYRGVAAWCDDFNVLFGNASL